MFHGMPWVFFVKHYCVFVFTRPRQPSNRNLLNSAVVCIFSIILKKKIIDKIAISLHSEANIECQSASASATYLLTNSHKTTPI